MNQEERKRDAGRPKEKVNAIRECYYLFLLCEHPEGLTVKELIECAKGGYFKISEIGVRKMINKFKDKKRFIWKKDREPLKGRRRKLKKKKDKVYVLKDDSDSFNRVTSFFCNEYPESRYLYSLSNYYELMVKKHLNDLLEPVTSATGPLSEEDKLIIRKIALCSSTVMNKLQNKLFKDTLDRSTYTNLISMFGLNRPESDSYVSKYFEGLRIYFNKAFNMNIDLAKMTIKKRNFIMLLISFVLYDFFDDVQKQHIVEFRMENIPRIKGGKVTSGKIVKGFEEEYPPFANAFYEEKGRLLHNQLTRLYQDSKE
jgi:hypothetical protein